MDAADNIDPADMKFDIDGIYSKDEFLLRLEYFSRIVPGMKQFFEERIPWAEAHDSETLFGWRVAENGVVRPYAFIELPAVGSSNVLPPSFTIPPGADIMRD